MRQLAFGICKTTCRYRLNLFDYFIAIMRLMQSFKIGFRQYLRSDTTPLILSLIIALVISSVGMSLAPITKTFISLSLNISLILINKSKINGKIPIKTTAIRNYFTVFIKRLFCSVYLYSTFFISVFKAYCPPVYRIKSTLLVAKYLKFYNFINYYSTTLGSHGVPFLLISHKTLGNL